jgi:hypothetical protein
MLELFEHVISAYYDTTTEEEFNLDALVIIKISLNLN